jgi:hypothetical protein
MLFIFLISGNISILGFKVVSVSYFETFYDEVLASDNLFS